MITIEKIRSSFAKLFDQAEPANTDTLRRKVLSGTQRANFEKILADWTELSTKLSSYRFPSQRLAVLCWHYNLAKIEDASDAVRLAIERVVYEGDSHEILHQDAMLHERFGPITARAREAIIDANRTLIPHLEAEIGKVTAAVEAIFSPYGCCGEIPDTGPIRMLSRSLLDAQAIATGAKNVNGGDVWIFTAGDVERGCREWL